MWSSGRKRVKQKSVQNLSSTSQKVKRKPPETVNSSLTYGHTQKLEQEDVYFYNQVYAPEYLFEFDPLRRCISNLITDYVIYKYNLQETQFYT